MTESASDPVVAALRGIAFAELGERPKARALVASAARALERRGDALLAERVRLAGAKIALDAHDLGPARRALAASAERLEALQDHTNCAWALMVAARAATLDGDTDASAELLEACRARSAGRVAAHVEATLAMAHAERAARDVDAAAAHGFARAAGEHAALSRNPTLIEEIDALRSTLNAPIAKNGDGVELDLSMLSALLRSPEERVVVDGHRRRVWYRGATAIDLSVAPVSFDLLSCIGRRELRVASMADIAREVFDAARPNASHEARIGVEISRLRALLPASMGRLRIERTSVRWDSKAPVAVVWPLASRLEARARALLSNGRAWPTKALSNAMGASPRSVKELLRELCSRHLVRSFGGSRSLRYAAETGTERISSRMLLLGLVADG
jgi:hypothetical protein